LYGIEVVVQIEVLIALWVSVLFVEREEGQEEGKKGGVKYILVLEWNLPEILR